MRERLGCVRRFRDALESECSVVEVADGGYEGGEDLHIDAVGPISPAYGFTVSPAIRSAVIAKVKGVYRVWLHDVDIGEGNRREVPALMRRLTMGVSATVQSEQGRETLTLG